MAEIEDQLHLVEDADAQWCDALQQDEETARKDKIKKNKGKYLPIPDRDTPIIAPVIAATYAIHKMDKGLYVEMYYYTNKGLEDALSVSSTVDDEAMVMLRNPNGSTSWVPAASTHETRGMVEDKDLKWKDFCQAVPCMILAIEQAGWPDNRPGHDGHTVLG